ncbi:hypothetical protein GCM10023190_22770 [Enteractinococcus fodinae]|uniref:Crotonobetainyl-CoA:carnitine CoA-transferase CaiB-like acyl-CoA transferase n=1 Tax=Enteractinococcus fodinae TaxID=684663 RepID=A0ABU2B2X8_9MICC|nr:CaiB/BaiF CoA-transferase family protein [Enteractinococcus fodinae]MDR7347963.1 crotonobetainyl-CoA:carnitine CoA-transferase CaiB-like acyl-CoA transferase [Enteractinococcus fodinae]
MSATWGSLAGLRVVDLSRVLGGPYATQILADHGAEVIKVESPQGDETRHWGPPFVSEGVAWYFAGVNRNKKSVVLDLTQDSERQRLLRLLEDADVLVENFKSGTLEKWGMGYHEVLSVQYPRLVHASITGFGDDGPLGGLPGYDAVVQAEAGLMSVNGTAYSGPTRIGMPAVDMITGLNTVNGILMALREREQSGRGQRVETTLFDCGISVMHPHMPNYFGTGRVPELTGNDHPNIAPYSTYATGSGEVAITVGNDRQFAKLCEYLGIPETATDDRFANNAARCGHRAELREVLETAMADTDAATVAQDLMAMGVPCGAINTVDQVVQHPHAAHRKMFVELEGGYRGVASPVKMSRTPAEYRLPPPAHGEHTAEVFESQEPSSQSPASR